MPEYVEPALHLSPKRDHPRRFVPADGCVRAITPQRNGVARTFLYGFKGFRGFNRYRRFVANPLNPLDPLNPLNLTPILALIIFVAGAVAGGLGIALGLGGGIFLVPFLTLALGFSLKTAAAVSLSTVRSEEHT